MTRSEAILAAIASKLNDETSIQLSAQARLSPAAPWDPVSMAALMESTDRLATLAQGILDWLTAQGARGTSFKTEDLLALPASKHSYNSRLIATISGEMDTLLEQTSNNLSIHVINEQRACWSRMQMRLNVLPDANSEWAKDHSADTAQLQHMRLTTKYWLDLLDSHITILNKQDLPLIA